MKRTIQTLLTITSLAAGFAAMPASHLRAEDPAKPAAAQDPQTAALQGKWEGVEVRREDAGKCTLTIRGNTVEFQGGNKDEWYKGTFTLPANTTPLQMDATIKDCPAPQAIGLVAHASYKIENGALTLISYRPGTPSAPKDFVGDAETRTFILKKAE
jgi:uncharacterized protein (TIGR03067 family)